MRRLLAVFASLSLSALLSGGACEPPPRPTPDPDKNRSKTCDVGGQEIPLPDESPVRPAGGEIDLGCVGSPVVLEQSVAVRVQGCVDVFGIGGLASRGIKVALFDADQDPKTDVPAHGEVDIAVAEDAANLDCAGADASTAACMAVACAKKGAYAMADIPVHVPLTMKVHAPGDPGVIDTYSFGIVFDYGTEVAADGVVDYEANVIYDDTYFSIPSLAGQQVEGRDTIGDGVGRGIIAGEVHDCDDVIVQGATVATNQADSATKVTFFNGDTEDPEPNLLRGSTNTDGLYVILNVTTEPGKETHVVSGTILDPACADGETCQCLSVGSRTVKAYPDSVSIVTLRGDLPVLN